MELQKPSARVFLLLQGTSSPLFAKIADRLEEKGHRCFRINLNLGDQLFWRRKGGFQYRGRGGSDWRGYVAAFMDRHSVTDLVLLGEERPYHQLAIAAARERKIDVFVVEMGYLRPDWLTLERDGMSSNSHFPVDPQHILRAGLALDEPDWTPRHSQTFTREAGYDLLYNLSNVFFWFLFPYYRRHAVFHPLLEYFGWVRRFAGAAKRNAAAKAVVDRMLSSPEPFFVFPLQLQTDFQLRAHSPYNDQREAIDEVLASFAAHAPPGTQLVVKIHPLDNGLVDWKSYIDKTSASLQIAERVSYLDGGDLNALLMRAQGTITVNSTVGLNALQLGRPVKVLGAAVFDIAGLSDQAALDQFWSEPRGPEEPLRTAFFRLLAAAIQVRGNLYSVLGTDAGAIAVAERLHDRSVNQPDGFVDPPPRTRPSKMSPRR